GTSPSIPSSTLLDAPSDTSMIGALLRLVEFAVYTSAAFRTLVTSLGMRSSMGRTGVCWDNSMAESFFSMLKNERVYRTVYATKTQARSDIIRYIEGFYNSRRRHSALGYRRPNEVHYGYQQPALAA
ncbi:transposase InsO family protein, partial [Cryobacterium sp. MP_3.1]|uniref:integrase core domain-containing protein n=1 Tax=Cryobacterium sp. MP_3.1 TaxID=3071711 RepID=UPI002DF85CE3|nr:transposase InsO family protein [Cryobacterium sp. MP_3.1]